MGNFPHKGLWRNALMFSLICTWTNVWVKNQDGGGLRHHCAHYEVTVMIFVLRIANFAVTGGMSGCFDNLWCHHWRQSWLHDSSQFSLVNCICIIAQGHYWFRYIFVSYFSPSHYPNLFWFVSNQTAQNSMGKSSSYSKWNSGVTIVGFPFMIYIIKYFH